MVVASKSRQSKAYDQEGGIRSSPRERESVSSTKEKEKRWSKDLGEKWAAKRFDKAPSWHRKSSAIVTVAVAEVEVEVVVLGCQQQPPSLSHSLLFRSVRLEVMSGELDNGLRREAHREQKPNKITKVGLRKRR
ncbi:hypothetical protein ACLOJK_030965 [Asimina triloba]